MLAENTALPDTRLIRLPAPELSAWFAGGTEIIGAAALMLLVTGPGRFSLDGAFTRARHRRR